MIEPFTDGIFTWIVRCGHRLLDVMQEYRWENILFSKLHPLSL